VKVVDIFFNLVFSPFHRISLEHKVENTVEYKEGNIFFPPLFTVSLLNTKLKTQLNIKKEIHFSLVAKRK
jgi:hypothetical protein